MIIYIYIQTYYYYSCTVPIVFCCLCNNYVTSCSLPQQILLTEQFEESLAIFMRMFNWDPIDMTYCRRVFLSDIMYIVYIPLTLM